MVTMFCCVYCLEIVWEERSKSKIVYMCEWAGMLCREDCLVSAMINVKCHKKEVKKKKDTYEVDLTFC